MSFLATYWRSEAGASAVEYAMILGIIGVALAAGAIILGGAIGNSMNDSVECIQGNC